MTIQFKQVSMHTLIVLKNGNVIKQVTNPNTAMLKKALSEADYRLDPYFDDAVYHGTEKAIFGTEHFTILYQSWNIHDTWTKESK